MCPGCGGRNAPSALECDWCGRPFASAGRRLRLSGWQVASTLLLGMLAAAVVALGWLNAGRTLPSLPRSSNAEALAAAPLVQLSPTPAVTPRVTAVVTPTPRPLLTADPGVGVASQGASPAADRAAVPTPEPPPRVRARVADTNGLGLTVRRDPGPQSPPLGGLREGTVITLTGEEQTIAARLWREVVHESSGLRGWVSADFLEVQS